MEAIRFFALCTAIVLFLKCEILVNAHDKKSPPVPAVLIFGDSTMDTGNNNYFPTIVRANFPPYGRDFEQHKPTGRFSNGKLTSDMIATNLGVKEHMPAYLSPSLTAQDLLTGVVFASAGSGYDIKTSMLVHAISLKQQLEMFQQYKEKLKNLVGEEKANQIISKSLYVVSGGGNDIIQYFNNVISKHTMTPEGYSENLKYMAVQFVSDLYKLGARKIGVIGIPPVGCVPFQRTAAGGILRKCSESRNQVALSYNSKMKAEFDQITKHGKLPGVKLVLVNVYPRLMEIIQHPEKYGFKEVSRGCCGTGLVEGSWLCNNELMTCRNVSEFVFWDSYHPTERVIKILSSSTKENLKPLFT